MYLYGDQNIVKTRGTGHRVIFKNTLLYEMTRSGYVAFDSASGLAIDPAHREPPTLDFTPRLEPRAHGRYQGGATVLQTGAAPEAVNLTSAHADVLWERDVRASEASPSLSEAFYGRPESESPDTQWERRAGGDEPSPSLSDAYYG